MRVLRGDPQAAVEFVHVINPDDWQEILFEVMLLDVAFAPAQGIVLRQSRPGESLLRACLARKDKCLDFDDLQRLAGHLQAPFRGASRK
eukprot:12404165-Karenia_brevis.AAC.1